MLAVGKDLGVIGQIGTAAVDQIDAGQPVGLGDLLGAQMLLHRHRIIGAALDGRIVADDHAFAARDPADAGDDARAGDVTVIKLMGSERRQLQEGRAGVDQLADALARQELAARDMTFTCGLRTAKRSDLEMRVKLGVERLEGRAIAREFLAGH